MASNTQPPKVTYYDPNGRKFTINTFQHLQAHFNDVDVNDNATILLIDGVSNKSLVGSGMKLFSIPVTHEYVDVIGASDGVDAGMSNLIVATYCAMVTSSRGGVILEYSLIVSYM